MRKRAGKFPQCVHTREVRQVMALTGRLQLCHLSSSNVHAESQKTYRLPLFVCVHTSTRCDPAHTAVRKDPPKLCVVIFAVFDRIPKCLSDFIAIIRMPSGNEVFECDLSGKREAQLSTARRRDPDLILAQIPLPQPEIS